jgi:arginyl-tRNA--protein-N-Asp/Glu arginylyltransferase
LARLLDVIQEEPRQCSYLADRLATLEHRIMVDVTAAELERLLEHGWRRFGVDYFRPACGACSACIPTRVPTRTFMPSKSQRRARKACAALEVQLGPPRFDDERLGLYHRWHRYREGQRGWEEADLSERGYRLQFAFPHPAARELAFIDSATGKLVGIALSDETDRAWSAIYFFYDPEWADRSIGTANVVIQIAIARAKKIPYVYLGYRVADCASLAYKQRFKPQEALVGWPEDDETPECRLIEE